MKKNLTDALTCAANISYLTSEYSAIYPITPSSAIGEIYSKKSENGEKNIFGNVPKVDVMESELGAISSSNGSLWGGSYSTTFTSSQGLLLMIPNLYKLSSSQKPFVLTVSARSLSTHALNIFCDHSDVMATRQTGFTMLCSSTTQKVEDFAMLANMITLKSKIPVMHFFDGFITSHKQDMIDELTLENIKNLFPFKEFYEFKKEALNSTNPKVFGTNQNPDIFFQNREKIEIQTRKLPSIINECFNEFYRETGRKYSIFEYFGDKNATKIIVSMGSSTETLKSVLKYLPNEFGLISVNVFNPFVKEEFLKVLPKSTKIITILDRTKENGSICEPLAQNVISCLQNKNIEILTGRYGLGGKDFDLNCAKACFLNMDRDKKTNFTVNIVDDICQSNLKLENENFDEKVTKIGFFGLGSDGLVSSSKIGMKILNKFTNLYISGNNYYDSKKSGNLTESQIFLSKEKIEINYKVKQFDYAIISNSNLLVNFDLAYRLNDNATLIINATKEEIEAFPNYVKNLLSNKNCTIYYINADNLAKKYNLNNKINIIMLSTFFKLTNYVDYKILKEEIKRIALSLYGTSCDYIDDINDDISEFPCPVFWKSLENTRVEKSNLEKIIRGEGDDVPVSFFNINGDSENINLHSSLDTHKAEWKNERCIQCKNCIMSCPHSAIKLKIVKDEELENAPKDFKFLKTKNGDNFCLFVDTKKCTGCSNCVNICPTKALILEKYSNNEDFFNSLKSIKQSTNLSFENDYFACNTACNGCNEILYYKLLGKMFGDHLCLTNATGCSSIYNGAVGCSPFIKDQNGFGTSFISNLFEDNAEFGYGITNGNNLSRENLKNYVEENLLNFSEKFKTALKDFVDNFEDFDKTKEIYNIIKDEKPKNEFDEFVKNNINFIVKQINFIVGGDGWAYDIGFSGLDHIVATNKNVNILILDNELYANTGGQTSKSTNYGAKTKYTNKKDIKKKDLFLSLFQYDNLYFSKVCYHADKKQCINSIVDAVNHKGPSIILAYCPCVNHKINMQNSLVCGQKAVKCGYFNLMTFKDKTLTLDSTPDFSKLEEFLTMEGIYKNLNETERKILIKQKENEYEFYLKLSQIFNKK